MTSNLRTVHISTHVPLLIILLIFTVLSVYYSLILPLGEAPDETVHFDVIQFIARTGHPPFTATERSEAGLRGGFAPLYYTLMAIPLSLMDTNPPPQLRRLDQRPERHIPADGLSTQQILHTEDELIPGQGVVLAWRLVRWFSIPLGCFTIFLTYAITRLILPQTRPIAWGAAIFVAFLPRFVINSSVINEDNLAIPLAAAILWFLLKIMGGDPRARLFVGLGLVLALATLTKYYNLILLLEVIVFLALATWHRRWTGKETLQRGGLTALTFAIVAGPWFVFILWRFGRIVEQGWLLGLATALGEPQIIGGLQKLQGGAAFYQVMAPTFGPGEWFFSLLFRSFWAEFGWMTVFAPSPFYWLLGGVTVCAVAGVLAALYTHRTVLKNVNKLYPWLLLAVHIVLFSGIVSLRYSLGQTIDTGQGRHLYPALPAIAIFFVLGLASFSQLISPEKPDSRRFTWLNVGLAVLLLAIGISFSLLSILPRYYPYLPVTTTINTSENSELSILPATDDSFALIGYASPTTVAAGEALPVKLTWQINHEVNQDYLVSLCLQDKDNRPAACWRGQFNNGNYPARAWEAGDILADTVNIPIPTCHRLTEQPYHLELELWLLVLDNPKPTVTNSPIFTHTFTQTAITILPTDSLKNLPQTSEVWAGEKRLVNPTNLTINQALTYITYAAHNANPVPLFTHIQQNQSWLPLAQFNTDLYLPCDDGPSPFAQTAHFMVDPTLTSGEYQTNSASIPPLTLALRNRTLAPLTATLTFSHTLAPLSIQLPDQPAISFILPESKNNLPSSSLQPRSRPAFILHPSSLILPLSIAWQSHRWMADPLVISLKLLDKDFNIGGEYVAQLGNRYPNVLWIPTEMVQETYPVRINPAAPPGLYQLEFSLIHQDKRLPAGYTYLPVFDNGSPSGNNLYPATLRLLDPAHGTPPPIPFLAQLGDSIKLMGYNVDSPLPSLLSPLSLTLYWQNTALIPTGYTVFTQLIGPDGQVWAQWDNPPQAGRYPTSAWIENDSVIDRYTLTLREGAPAGDYRLLVGMYDPSTGERLPATIKGQLQADNAIQLAVLSLNP